jgi:hypothetical protein
MDTTQNMKFEAGPDGLVLNVLFLREQKVGTVGTYREGVNDF